MLEIIMEKLFLLIISYRTKICKDIVLLDKHACSSVRIEHFSSKENVAGLNPARRIKYNIIIKKES